MGLGETWTEDQKPQRRTAPTMPRCRSGGTTIQTATTRAVVRERRGLTERPSASGGKALGTPYKDKLAPRSCRKAPRSAHLSLEGKLRCLEEKASKNALKTILLHLQCRTPCGCVNWNVSLFVEYDPLSSRTHCGCVNWNSRWLCCSLLPICRTSHEVCELKPSRGINFTVVCHTPARGGQHPPLASLYGVSRSPLNCCRL